MNRVVSALCSDRLHCTSKLEPGFSGIYWEMETDGGRSGATKHQAMEDRTDGTTDRETKIYHQG